ncbi:MAG: hypothetical protein HGA51_01030 [Demequinaceae bacterium]|nr:hypothetical protein [Demequinaceae bacterium]
MSKFSTAVLAVAGVATVAMIGIAASATAATLPMITGSSSSSTSTGTITLTPTPSITPSATPSITPSATADPSSSEITADIYVALGGVDDTQPMEFQVTGVVVGDGPELTGADLIANPSEYCGDAEVDISLNPTTITVTGGPDYCNFQAAYVEVTLHGIEFSSTTLLSDNLFEPSLDKEGLGLAGGSYRSRGLRLGATDSNPVLDSYGVTASTFSAYWSGQDWNDMSGAAVFSWVPVALAAPGAAAVASFTG